MRIAAGRVWTVVMAISAGAVGVTSGCASHRPQRAAATPGAEALQPPAGPHGPFVEYCVERERALRRYRTRCWPDRLAGADRAVDPETASAPCLQAAPLAVSSGQVAFDAARAARCIEHLDSAPCVAPLLLDLSETVCAEAFTPRLSHGDTCYADVALVLDASSCIDGFCAADGCPAECEPFRELGERCSHHEPCAADLHCAGDGRCVERERQGAACSFDGTCAAGLLCDFASDTCAPALELGASCVEGDFCRASDCLGGICQHRVPSAGPCRYNANCPAGERCFDSKTVDQRACAPALTAGAPCAVNEFGCSDGLYCRNGICAPPPGVGEFCLGIHSEGFVCADGLRCGSYVNLEQRCLEELQQEDSCPYEDVVAGVVGDLCASGLLCMPNGRCMPPAGEGEPCRPLQASDSTGREGSCEAGLWCDPMQGRCTAALREGERCTLSDLSMCGRGLACVCDPRANDCGNGVIPTHWHCTPLKHLGDACEGSHECHSLACGTSTATDLSTCIPSAPYCFGPT